MRHGVKSAVTPGRLPGHNGIRHGRQPVGRGHIGVESRSRELGHRPLRGSGATGADGPPAWHKGCTVRREVRAAHRAFQGRCPLRVQLRFWPEWPATGTHAATFSLIGFTKAYAELLWPRPERAVGSPGSYHMGPRLKFEGGVLGAGAPGRPGCRGRRSRARNSIRNVCLGKVSGKRGPDDPDCVMGPGRDHQPGCGWISTCSRCAASPPLSAPVFVRARPWAGSERSTLMNLKGKRCSNPTWLRYRDFDWEVDIVQELLSLPGGEELGGEAATRL